MFISHESYIYQDTKTTMVRVGKRRKRSSQKTRSRNGKWSGRVCKECGGPLKVVGRDRKNGVQHHGDWLSRSMHKKCYRELYC